MAVFLVIKITVFYLKKLPLPPFKKFLIMSLLSEVTEEKEDAAESQ